MARRAQADIEFMMEADRPRKQDTHCKRGQLVVQARTVASHGGWWLRHVACWNIEWRWTAIIGTDIFQMDILCVRSALLVTDDLNLVGFVLTHASRMLLRCCLNRIGAKVDVQEGSAFVILPRSASPFVTTRPSGDLSRVAAGC